MSQIPFSIDLRRSQVLNVHITSMLFTRNIYFMIEYFTQYFTTVSGFFIPGFPKLQRFQAHHELILSKLLPKLKKHLVSTSVPNDM